MADDLTTIMSACGRLVGPEEVRHAQEVVGMCSGLSRHELALTLCEHWGWVGATGKPQIRACWKVLERLEKKGLLELPAKRGHGRPGPGHTAKLEVAAQKTPPGPIGGVRSGKGAPREPRTRGKPRGDGAL